MINSGISPTNESDLDTLALLLIETRESIKTLVKQEEELRMALKRNFKVGMNVLELPSTIVMRGCVNRMTVDKIKLMSVLGEDFVKSFSKETSYEVVSVVKKHG